MKKKSKKICEKSISISDLPYECLASILLFIHTKYIFNLRLVDKNFHHAISRPMSWSTRTLTIFNPPKTSAQTRKRFEKALGSLFKVIKPVKIVNLQDFYGFLYDGEENDRGCELHFEKIDFRFKYFFDFLQYTQKNISKLSIGWSSLTVKGKMKRLSSKLRLKEFCFSSSKREDENLPSYNLTYKDKEKEINSVISWVLNNADIEVLNLKNFLWYYREKFHFDHFFGTIFEFLTDKKRDHKVKVLKFYGYSFKNKLCMKNFEFSSNEKYLKSIAKLEKKSKFLSLEALRASKHQLIQKCFNDGNHVQYIQNKSMVELRCENGSFSLTSIVSIGRIFPNLQILTCEITQDEKNPITSTEMVFPNLVNLELISNDWNGVNFEKCKFLFPLQKLKRLKVYNTGLEKITLKEFENKFNLEYLYAEVNDVIRLKNKCNSTLKELYIGEIIGMSVEQFVDDLLKHFSGIEKLGFFIDVQKISKTNIKIIMTKILQLPSLNVFELTIKDLFAASLNFIETNFSEFLFDLFETQKNKKSKKQLDLFRLNFQDFISSRSLKCIQTLKNVVQYSFKTLILDFVHVSDFLFGKINCLLWKKFLRNSSFYFNFVEISNSCRKLEEIVNDILLKETRKPKFLEKYNEASGKLKSNLSQKYRSSYFD